VNPPPVTVVLPVRNEQAHLADCLDSLLAQDYPAVSEVLVVDGRSTDRTRDLAAGRGRAVRVIDNPGLTAASAMNVGIAAATTELVVRADAHTVYARDYVSRSVEVLADSGADWVGGPMRPVGRTPFGRAVAAVTSSPFGVGPGRFHYATTAQDVDTVYLGTFRRSIVDDVGGYDTTTLQWAAEDQELAYRLRRAGRRVRVDPSIRSAYFPRQDVRGLWRQYRNYGMCKASTLAKHHRLPSWRPLAPAALVAATVVTVAAAAAARRPSMAAAPVLGYAVGVGVLAERLSDEPGVSPHRVAAALAVCHWSYGIGFWSGVGRIIRRRPFDTRPGGA
jgi:succinoglycan biosynthesis protein ExoA